MDDLRGRFARLDSVPAPDLWTAILRRAEELGAPEATAVARGRVGARRVEPDALRSRRLPAGPTFRALLVLALLAAVAVATVVAGTWWVNRESVLSSDDPAVVASKPPVITRIDRCEGMRFILDVRETHDESNTEASWTALEAVPRPAGPGLLGGIRIDELSEVGVIVVDPSTGRPCRLVDLGTVGLLPREVRWSPEGNSIAIVNQLWAGSGESHLLVWSDGETPTLSRPWIGAELPGIAWSPEATALALVADRQLTIVASDGSAQVIPCDPCQAPAEVSWSPDGAVLAIEATAPGAAPGSSAIYLLERDGSSSRRLDIGRDRIDFAGWRDDGTILVFDYESDRLLDVPLDGPASLTVREQFQALDGVAYVFSPDLTGAVYVENQGRGKERLMYVNVKTGATRFLLATAGLDDGLPVGAVAWAPDGQSVAFTLVRPGPDWPLGNSTWTVRADGSELRPILAGPFDLTDGRAFGSGIDIGSWQPRPPG